MFGMLPRHLPRVPRDPYEIMERARREHEALGEIMGSITGAYRVHVKDGIVTVYAKTRVPRTP